jgi:integrase
VVKHHPAITDPAEIGGLLRAMEGYMGTVATRCALRLSALVFLRPGELRHAEWNEIDLDAEAWTIPGAKMKGRKTQERDDHIIPLSRQAVAVLREMQALTGGGRYVFPSERAKDRPLSENTVNAALRRLGYADEMVAHGFRAMARTVLDEVMGFRVEVIEHQQAHAVRDPLGRSYNRTTHLEERKRMMQAWADYLDSLKAGQPATAGNVVQFKAAK